VPTLSPNCDFAAARRLLVGRGLHVIAKVFSC